MKSQRFDYLIPLLISLLLIALNLSLKAIEAESVVPQSKVVYPETPDAIYCQEDSACTGIMPGFKTEYYSDGRWKWSYYQEMKNGCEKLLFRNDPVTVKDDGVINIELKTYLSDDMCEKPSIKSGVTGAINTGNSNTTFKVFVDGELVAESVK